VPRLLAFRDLVRLRAAVVAEPGRGLLGIDWVNISRITKNLKQIEGTLIASVNGWVERITVWSEIVRLKATAGSGRYQADILTRAADDSEVRQALIFMLTSLLAGIRTLPEPTSRVVQLVNVPEAILQTLAAGFCGVDFSRPPKKWPEADYGSYFGGRGNFELPQGDQKMTLGSLLVIVPAILSSRISRLPAPFSDPATMRPLQQKLVDGVRNPASHTIAAFPETDAAFLCALCQEWLGAWAALEGLGSTDEVPGLADAPSGEQLADILFGQLTWIAPDHPA
jgi:hypothetical protein